MISPKIGQPTATTVGGKPMNSLSQKIHKCDCRITHIVHEFIVVTCLHCLHSIQFHRMNEMIDCDS